MLTLHINKLRQIGAIQTKRLHFIKESTIAVLGLSDISQTSSVILIGLNRYRLPEIEENTTTLFYSHSSLAINYYSDVKILNVIILGDRILVSKIKEEKKEGEFQTVEVQDSFLYKGKVEQIGEKTRLMTFSESGTNIEDYPVKEGAIVLFAKYSPHTQMISVEGEDMKVIRAEDVIAVE